LVLQAATLAILLFTLWRRPAPAAGALGAGPQSAEELRRVALELENKSLSGPAASVWEKYLDRAPAADDRLEILYRIGKLHLQAEQYGPAAAAFVHAEQLAPADGEWKKRIGPQLVTCLRRLGLYGEVGRELSRRVEVGAGGAGPGRVLAKLAGETLTEADLDRMLERRVDQLLAMQGATGDEAARQELLKQLSAPQLRTQLFQELLQRELFTRRARELKLDQDAEFQAAHQALAEDLLARRFLERELGTIRPTETDLESFYKAHPESYRQPESLRVTYFPLRAGEDPQSVLKAVKSADDFKKLAAERAKTDGRPPETTQDQTAVRGQPHPPLGDIEPLFALEAGKWTTTPLVSGDTRHLALVESKTPERLPPLDEVRQRVEADYRSRKVQELSQQLFRDLMTRYEVRIEPLDKPSPSAKPDELAPAGTKASAPPSGPSGAAPAPKTPPAKPAPETKP
jgi:peptidyl-prolyl cis-trans isomerase C